MSDGRASTISRSRVGKIAYSDVFTLEDYLEFIRTRLVLIKELMSEQGSIYIWNDVTSEMTTNSIDHYKKIDINGRRYTTIPLHAPGETVDGETGKAWKGVLPPIGRHWRTNLSTLDQWDHDGLIEWSKNNNPRKKVYLDERSGSKIQDIWEFKDNPYPIYPTEKNLNMLKQIILNSSSESSIVLDCFCGSGSTLLAADQCKREWIGIDNSQEAINTARARLSEITATYEEYKISATTRL